MSYVGITTTVPVEIVYAAGLIPLDLNNVLIEGQDGQDGQGYINSAEQRGYPRNICGWIKGIYGIVSSRDDIGRVIAVTQGDCSNTHALMETLELVGKNVIPFAYPYDRTRSLLSEQMHILADRLGTGWDRVLKKKIELDSIRKKAHRIDELTWLENKATGLENHVSLVSCSDFEGNPEGFEKKLDEKILEIESRVPVERGPRIGLIGVPPMMTDLHDTIEGYGARVVFNEVSRQFSMPFDTDNIVEQYLLYTYPYSVFEKIADINREIQRRELDGIIHYVQSFCFRQIEDLIYREKLNIPILTLEGGDSFRTDQRQRMRIQAFVEMLS